MGWFPDQFWLFVESWIWVALGALLGLAIGWWFWYRNRGADTSSSKNREQEQRVAAVTKERDRWKRDHDKLESSKETAVANVQAKLDKCREESTTRRDRIAELEAEVKDLSDKKVSLQASLKDRDREVSNLSAEVEKGQAKFATLKSDVSGQDGRVDDLQTEIDARGTRITSLQAAATAKDKEVAELKAKLVELETKGKALDDAETKADSLATLVAQRDATAEELQTKLKAKDDELAELRGDVSNKDTRIAELQAELSATESQAAALRADLATKDEQLADLEHRSSNGGESAGLGMLAGASVGAAAVKLGLDGKTNESSDVDESGDAVEVPPVKLAAVADDAGTEKDDESTVPGSDASVHEPDAFSERLAEIAAERPVGEGEEDDLTEINGVGPKMKQLLNDNGLYTFYQVALLDDDAVDALEGRIDAFPGRIRRDNWVPQAAQLHQQRHGEDISGDVTVEETEQDAFTRALTALSEDDAAGGSYTDDLTEISGVGPKMNQLLNDNGLYTFKQVSVLNDEAVAALNDRLQFFPGRIQRDNWVDQAKELHAKHHG